MIFVQCQGVELASGLNLADRFSNLCVKEFSNKQRCSRSGRGAVLGICKIKSGSFLWSGPNGMEISIYLRY